jgi:hypothetical protein
VTTREQLDPGPLVAAIGGGLLIVSLFLDWYEPAISGWTAFETLDLALAGLGLAALGVLASGSAYPCTDDYRSILTGPAASLIGGLAVLIVASQALNHPPAAVDRGGEVGQCLALGGARLMLAGGALGFARLSIAVSVKGRRLSPLTVSGPLGIVSELGSPAASVWLFAPCR